MRGVFRAICKEFERRLAERRRALETASPGPETARRLADLAEYEAMLVRIRAAIAEYEGALARAPAMTSRYVDRAAIIARMARAPRELPDAKLASGIDRRRAYLAHGIGLAFIEEHDAGAVLNERLRRDAIKAGLYWPATGRAAP